MQLFQFFLSFPYKAVLDKNGREIFQYNVFLNKNYHAPF